MKFRFSETPWDTESWFDGGEVVDGVLTTTPETDAAIASRTAWGHCVASMVDSLAAGQDDIGPHVIFEGSKWWRW